MKKTLIIYASMSGNTEDIAKLIGKRLEEDEMEITYEEMDACDLESIKEFDYILAGSYTWGDGDLPYEAEDFYEDLASVDLTGKNIGCFGSGDHTYPKFCEAVDLLQRRFTETGAAVFADLLKIEGSPESEEDISACIQFAEAFSVWCAKSGKVTLHVS
ncbi:flavodoxin [Metabacillus idriensis]|uniref:flavodoxin n=1 Tax=Metabacillus idriensis TaxID=324768 RepID=UPI003D28B704